MEKKKRELGAQIYFNLDLRKKIYSYNRCRGCRSCVDESGRVIARFSAGRCLQCHTMDFVHMVMPLYT